MYQMFQFDYKYQKIIQKYNDKNLCIMLKEYIVDKERLEILIKDISKLDSDLYTRRYRVAPDPTVRIKVQRSPDCNKLFVGNHAF